MEYESHPAADLFPMMTDAELDALGEDMLQHGQREPINPVPWPDTRRPQPLSRLHREGHRAEVHGRCYGAAARISHPSSLM